MTPDDDARLRAPFRSADDQPYETKLTPQARPNVLFEAGMAMGRHPDRTVLVELGKIRPFSDIGGRYVIRLNDTGQKRQELAQYLENAGCLVDLTGTDWHSTGNFLVDSGPASSFFNPHLSEILKQLLNKDYERRFMTTLRVGVSQLLHSKLDWRKRALEKIWPKNDTVA